MPETNEKQTNSFRYLKFHDWLVTADRQTKLTTKLFVRRTFLSG